MAVKLPQIVFKVTLFGLLPGYMIACFPDKTAKTSKASDTTLVERTKHKAPDSTTGQGEDFDSFYKRFHSDSLFQLSRVIFPVKGYNQDLHSLYEDTSTVGNFTPRDKWIIMRALPINPKEYIFKLVRSKNQVVETITSNPSNPSDYAPGFKIEIHFRLKRGKWYLTHYDYFDN